MNRGSASCNKSAKADPRGFNEAPIHESGKYRSRREQVCLLGCFNEAPIHESGKCPGIAQMRSMRVASMRPRFMNRGS